MNETCAGRSHALGLRALLSRIQPTKHGTIESQSLNVKIPFPGMSEASRERAATCVPRARRVGEADRSVAGSMSPSVWRRRPCRLNAAAENAWTCSRFETPSCLPQVLAVEGKTALTPEASVASPTRQFSASEREFSILTHWDRNSRSVRPVTGLMRHDRRPCGRAGVRAGHGPHSLLRRCRRASLGSSSASA
jgi:hypothetical protein